MPHQRGIAAVALAAAFAVTLRASPPVSLRVAFLPEPTVPATVVVGALEETARIWRPYGLDVTDGTPAGASGSVTVAVALDVRRESGDGDIGLGDIRFSPDGVPDAAVTLYYRALVRLASGVTATLPLKGQNQIVSRAMGRALAHEIGHFVLRSPHHAERGLMRSRLRVSTLTDPSRRELALTPLDCDRLRIVFRDRSQPGHQRDSGDGSSPLRR